MPVPQTVAAGSATAIRADPVPQQVLAIFSSYHKPTVSPDTKGNRLGVRGGFECIMATIPICKATGTNKHCLPTEIPDSKPEHGRGCNGVTQVTEETVS